jgi:hypothetical protein
MAKIDINKLAKMITEDPDVFLEYENIVESYPMSIDNPRLVRGDPKSPLVMARQAVTDFGMNIRHADKLGDKAAADNYRNELRKILGNLKYQWQKDPHASELLDV